MFGKRGQITIFIIIAVILVASVALFFVLRKGGIQKVGVSEDVEISSFLKTCLEDTVHEGVELIGLQGGNINPTFYKTFKFGEEPYRNISYLCYTGNFYSPCKNLEPLLISHVKKELENYISDDVRTCFDDLVLSLEKQGYEVNSEYDRFDIDFSLTRVIVNINGEINTMKAEETQKFEDMQIIIPSKIYDLTRIAQEILSQEGRFCYFNLQGFMLFYPEYEIDKFHTSDAITIYTIKYKNKKEMFRFAMRGCVFPSGW